MFDSIRKKVTSIDFSSKNVKMVMSGLIAMILSFILSPGVFFEIKPGDEKKIQKNKKITYFTALIHSTIIGILMSVTYKIYLSTDKKIASI